MTFKESGSGIFNIDNQIFIDMNKKTLQLKNISKRIAYVKHVRARREYEAMRTWDTGDVDIYLRKTVFIFNHMEYEAYPVSMENGWIIILEEL